jgi:hypothetical protein
MKILAKMDFLVDVYVGLNYLLSSGSVFVE